MPFRHKSRLHITTFQILIPFVQDETGEKQRDEGPSECRKLHSSIIYSLFSFVVKS